MRQIALLLVLVALALPAGADQQVEEIFARVKQINPGLMDYSADIKMALDARIAFVPYRPNIEGTYYHKRPDKHKVKLHKAPGYLRKYPNIFGWNLPRLERFTSRVVGTEKVAGRDCYHLELLPAEEMGDVQQVDLWVDTQNYTVPRHQTTYARDGLLTVEADYQTVDGYTVFKEMRANFRFPSASLTATARAAYTNYRFNQNLPDSLFKKEEARLR
ncbi:MAG: outer membrane lipoprotein-sorting protein [Candidatus Eremiobacterota bacterium]